MHMPTVVDSHRNTLRLYAHTHTHTHTHAHTHTRTQTHTDAHTHTYCIHRRLVFLRARSHNLSFSLVDIPTRTQTLALSCAHTHCRLYENDAAEELSYTAALPSTQWLPHRGLQSVGQSTRAPGRISKKSTPQSLYTVN